MNPIRTKDVRPPCECNITLACVSCGAVGVVASDHDTPKGWYWLVLPPDKSNSKEFNPAFCSAGCCAKWCAGK